MFFSCRILNLKMCVSFNSTSKVITCHMQKNWVLPTNIAMTIRWRGSWSLRRPLNAATYCTVCNNVCRSQRPSQSDIYFRQIKCWRSMLETYLSNSDPPPALALTNWYISIYWYINYKLICPIQILLQPHPSPLGRCWSFSIPWIRFNHTDIVSYQSYQS